MYGDTNLNWGFFTDESCQAIVKPRITSAQLKKVSKSGAYLLHNGEYISLFIGSQIPDDFASEVSGA